MDDALRTLDGSGIVYVLTVKETERLAGFLASRGHDVAAYNGQLTADTRAEVEERLRHNEVKAVVATSALGMGYDKPDLAFCLHVGSPGSPVDYYQQIGRAGRALDSAIVALLPAETDEQLWDYFATSSIPDPQAAARVLETLGEHNGAMTVPALEAATGVRRGRLELLVKVLSVDGAVRRTSDGWESTGEPWVYDEAHYDELRASRRAEADLMRDYARGAGCLEGFLRSALDDEMPPDYRCGRCSVCVGALPDGLPTRPGTEAVDAARTYLRGVDVIIEPRKMWTPGMAERRGRIAADDAVELGRALTFADDPGWPEVAELLRDGAPDREPPAWLCDALVEVLVRWRTSWPARATCVVAMPSRSHPTLISGLAAHLASVGRLPVLDALVTMGPAPQADVAASLRAREVETSIAPRARGAGRGGRAPRRRLPAHRLDDDGGRCPAAPGRSRLRPPLVVHQRP